jgi:hypothetical protein
VSKRSAIGKFVCRCWKQDYPLATTIWPVPELNSFWSFPTQVFSTLVLKIVTCSTLVARSLASFRFYCHFYPSSSSHSWFWYSSKSPQINPQSMQTSNFWSLICLLILSWLFLPHWADRRGFRPPVTHLHLRLRQVRLRKSRLSSRRLAHDPSSQFLRY